jgi:hypothetical protein
MMRYIANVAIEHLDRWSRDGVAPPRADRIAIDDSGPAPAIERDRFGNAVAGVRTPQLEVASLTYVPKTEGPRACGNLLHTVPIVPRAIEAVVGDDASHRRAFIDAVDRLEAERWLVPADADDLREGRVAVSEPRRRIVRSGPTLWKPDSIML